MRRTKIICTLGPAVDSQETLEKLILAGMDGARFNFSHGTHTTHLALLNKLKAARAALGRPVAAILDTKGPEIRIRTFPAGSIPLTVGQTFTLTTRDEPGTAQSVSVTYENLHNEVTPGARILIDDGLVELRTDRIEGQDIRCTVLSGSGLSDHKSINIPGAHICLPALTEQDRLDLRFAAEQGFDYVAASFVRSAGDVAAIRAALDEAGGQSIRIISKIENQEGVDRLDEIVAASDGVMVARGDLGVEVPAQKVPVLQKRIIRKCMEAGKLVVTATQMLDSMIRNPRPTRAEVSDVANAVFDGSGCVMLSGETASGKYPLEALTTMAAVVDEAERAIDYRARFQARPFLPAASVNDAITHTCCLTAIDLNARAILTATETGHTARMISRFRPPCPIAALTRHESVRRQLSLVWGVAAYPAPAVSSTDAMFTLCTDLAKKEALAAPGDTVVITAGVPIGEAGSTNLIKAQEIL